SKLAKDSFKALGGKSLGRIDIKMNRLGVPHFMEANLMPGLSKGYFYRSCLLNLDMTYNDMILSIAKNGLSTRQRESNLI
ncbi:MAG: D-alanine--D-alanine ligase, partial [Proteobacteria bacterium]|nr:D-alanine--D-alanine ligase [Pseudomonadota bacterium]